MKEIICQGFTKKGFYFILGISEDNTEIIYEFEREDEKTRRWHWNNTDEDLEMVLRELIYDDKVVDLNDIFFPDAIEMLDNELDLDYIGDLYDLVA